MKKTASLIVSLALLNFTFGSSMVSANENKFEKIKGDIYRFEDDRHCAVFLVTNEGIVLTNPLNTPAANWLKVELKKFFNVPQWVVCCHSYSYLERLLS